MNLQSRLNRLERDHAIKKTNRCECLGQNEVFVIEAGMTPDERAEIDAKIELAASRTHCDVCGKDCRKAFGKTRAVVVVECLESNIEPPSGAREVKR
jgi:hypothetical protein